MTSLPGATKPDMFAHVTTTPEQQEAARRYITWAARTDTDEALLLDALGLNDTEVDA